MFDSAVLDVAVGLIFVFLVVSLLASALTEMIASLLNLRAKTLLSGVKDILNDPSGSNLVKELYNHAFVNPRDQGNRSKADDAAVKPAYIDPKQFADALIQICNIAAIPRANTAVGPDGKPVVDTNTVVTQMSAAIKAKGLNGQIEEMLTGIINRASGDLDKIEAQIGSWFDNAMDRVSGAYKRTAQLISFLVAFGLAAGLNVDTIKVAEALWERPLLAKSIEAKNMDAITALKDLDNLGLPIGWYPVANGTSQASVPSLLSPIGWLITAIAALFGAPFWFDMLQTFVRIKGAGPSPEEKKAGTAAAA